MQLNNFLYKKNYIIQEYINGIEYNLDILNNKQKTLLLVQ